MHCYTLVTALSKAVLYRRFLCKYACSLPSNRAPEYDISILFFFLFRISSLRSLFFAVVLFSNIL